MNRGGERGVRPRAMTDNKLARALRMREDGHTYNDIAATIGVSPLRVSLAIADALEEQASE